MNKLLKNILPVLKRAGALIGVLMVLVCSLVVPSAAADITTNINSADVLTPLWNIQGLQITYNNGIVSVFQFPRYWFKESEAYINEIIINGEDHSTGFKLLLSDITIEPFQDSPLQYNLSFELDTNNIKKIDFIFDDTFIPYSDIVNYADNPNSAAETPVYGISVYDPLSSTSFSFSGKYNFAYPIYYKHTGTESSASITGRSLSSWGLRSLSEYPVENKDFYLTPRSIFTDAGAGVGVQFDEGFYPGGYDRYLYYYDLFADLTFNSSVESLSFSVPLIEKDYSINFFDWSKMYFPSYNFDFDDEGFSKLGTFLASTLGAFLNFNLIPGISIGMILFAVFGMSLFLLFVKFFAR